MSVVQAQALEHWVCGQAGYQAEVALAQRFHVVLGNTTHRLGAVDKLTQVFAHDAGQVQVLDGLGRQCTLSGGGFLRDVQPQRKARVAAQSIRISSRRRLEEESERRITADSSRPWVMLGKYDNKMTV